METMKAHRRSTPADDNWIPYFEDNDSLAHTFIYDDGALITPILNPPTFADPNVVAKPVINKALFHPRVYNAINQQ